MLAPKFGWCYLVFVVSIDVQKCIKYRVLQIYVWQPLFLHGSWLKVHLLPQMLRVFGGSKKEGVEWIRKKLCFCGASTRSLEPKLWNCGDPRGSDFLSLKDCSDTLRVAGDGGNMPLGSHWFSCPISLTTSEVLTGSASVKTSIYSTCINCTQLIIKIA